LDGKLLNHLLVKEFHLFTSSAYLFLYESLRIVVFTVYYVRVTNSFCFLSLELFIYTSFIIFCWCWGVGY